MPVSQEGYWTVVVNTSRPAPNQEGARAMGQVVPIQAKHSGSLVRCGIFGAAGCLQGDKRVTAQCAPGYIGNACSRCAPDRYVFFGKCYECETTWKKVRSVLYVLGLVFQDGRGGLFGTPVLQYDTPQQAVIAMIAAAVQDAQRLVEEVMAAFNYQIAAGAHGGAAPSAAVNPQHTLTIQSLAIIGEGNVGQMQLGR